MIEDSSVRCNVVVSVVPVSAVRRRPSYLVRVKRITTPSMIYCSYEGTLSWMTLSGQHLTSFSRLRLAMTALVRCKQTNRLRVLDTSIIHELVSPNPSIDGAVQLPIHTAKQLLLVFQNYWSWYCHDFLLIQTSKYKFKMVVRSRVTGGVTQRGAWF